KEEFLDPFGISAYRLSKEIKIPQTRISQIIKGKRRITADTALRLSEFFGNSPQFWMGIQDDYDLEEKRIKIEEELKDINRVKAS
ncbi:MAG: HigA family addiction module antitoxin, partial [Candidatus Caldatribacteriota bacterium]|nr:HigA family addiction module antitoxin [Candidatus Caldatribacteriota bacterium]